MRTFTRRLLTATVGTALAVPTAGAVGAVTAAPAAAEDYKVLVVGKTLGFRHSSIDEGTRAVVALGQSNGFTVDVFDPQQSAESLPGATKLESSPFTSAENLSQYATLVFISTVDGTNNLDPARPTLLNPSETAALQGYIRGGGGWVGLHAATDTMHTVPWFSQMTGGGARFRNHPAQQWATVHNEDRTHPSTAHLPEPWQRFDEWYNYTQNPRPGVHVLQTLVEASYNPGSGTMGNDHPISWCQNFEGGRSWYQGMGHTEASYTDPNFLQNMLGGIEWTAGVAEGNCTSFREIRDRINELVADGDLASHVAASLLDRLDRAEDVHQDSESQALAFLQQFVARANNQIKGDADDEAVRDELIASAQDIIERLTAQDADDRSVLVFTRTLGSGDRHPGTHTAGTNALRALGEQLDIDIDFTSSGNRFTDESLAEYDAVMFLNTRGDVLNDAQQAAFERFIRAGGGFVGTHSAIETETDWEFLTNLIGTRASGESGVGNAQVKVVDRVHPASAGLPDRWNLNGGNADSYYNFDENVRGVAHVLATVDETTYTGGTMGMDHPIMWCKDVQGGRSFYTGLGHSAANFNNVAFRNSLGGALSWAAGGDGDCGATVVDNFQMTTLASNQNDPTQLHEPTGFNVLPDRRVISTGRTGQVHLIDPEAGTNEIIANIPVYTHSEDGLYGPAVDPDFEENRWVYLYYAPVVMEGVSEITGKPFGDPETGMTPTGAAPTSAADRSAWDVWQGYFQLSRFKLVEATEGQAAHLDMGSEQKILKVEVNRGACCHVAGDIDFDPQGNLYMVTGDDTPAGGGNSGGFSPHNDMKTTESQTVRTTNATGGTFTITFDGQTTAPIAYDANAAAVQAALEALSNVEAGDVVVTGNNASTGNITVQFRGQYYQDDVAQATVSGTGLTGDGATATAATSQQGDWFVAPFVDARRSSLSTNDLRGKVLRIKVNADGSYTSPAGNLFPESADTENKTRPEIYLMGLRNPFRITVGDDGRVYIGDYSPDSRVPQDFRGPQGTGRYIVAERAGNYGWPLCYRTDLPYYRWDFNTSTPLDDPAQPYACGGSTQGPPNESRWNTGLTTTPPITNPELWYSYSDNTPGQPLGTPCFAAYNGSGATSCPQLFPEFGTGGVGPHGPAIYNYDAGVDNPTKFPEYFDDKFFIGEFTRDMMREISLDAQGRVLKINNTLPCGAETSATQPFLCDTPMDMEFGPDGNLYLLTYGDGFFRANPDARLVRFEYVKGTRAPEAVASATPSSGQAPLTVQFSSAGSRDPQDQDITYAWDFDGDGDTDSTEANPTYTYTANGTYTARLTVTNVSGQTGTTTVTVTVGNTAPTVTVTTPINGGFFSFGDRIPWTVTVTDPEDGVVDCSRVQVAFVLGHDDHGHGLDEFTGCSGVYQSSAGEAQHAGGKLFAAISASYTDNGGLRGTGQTTIQQRFQEAEAWDSSGTSVTFVNDPSPIGVSQNITVQSIDNGDWLSLGPVNFTNMTAVDLRVSGGNAAQNGGVRANIEVRLGSPDGTLVDTWPVMSTSNNNMNTQRVNLSNALVNAGANTVYLVFRPSGVDGQPTSNLFSFNWMSFVGQGVSAPAN
jgi:type 1 glutamine amidotransferase/PKD repeat protein/glucose/arabinose dehydrogenase